MSSLHRRTPTMGAPIRRIGMLAAVAGPGLATFILLADSSGQASQTPFAGARTAALRAPVSTMQAGSAQEVAGPRVVLASPFGPPPPRRPAQAPPSSLADATDTARPSTNPTQTASLAVDGRGAEGSRLPAASRAEPAPSPQLARAGSARLSLNTATREALDALGGRYGRAIAAARPYRSTDELISRRVLTRAAYARIRDRVSVD